ncbi:MAG: PD40 domain-containing protein [Deltaproteobacteria bacterium]|nr:PD40 domain-containing protein [Deltaproteobacteria bacterium]
MSYNFSGRYNICYLDFQLKQSFLLFSSTKISEYPAWHTNGKKLTFYSEIDGDRELYNIDINGQNLTRLTFSPGIDEDPNWSPDGNFLVFSSDRGHPKKQNLVIMNQATGSFVEISSGGGRNTVPKWSPDSKTIVFSTDRFWPGWDVGILELATRSERFLTSGILSYCRANYFKKKNAIVYSKGASKSVDLYELDMTNSKESLILGLSGREYDVEVLSDDKSLFFVHESSPGGNDFQLYFYDLGEKERKQITSSIIPANNLKSEGQIRYLSWIEK